MDAMIFLISLLFLSLVGAVCILFYKEAPKRGKTPLLNEKTAEKNEEARLTTQLQKKISSFEEKIKELQANLEAIQHELSQTKEREKALLKEKSSIAFDTEQYEKSKKEHHRFKEEVLKKEELLEKEIAARRQQTSELEQVQGEAGALKKRVTEAEDAYRKAQTKIAALLEELNLAKKTIEEQKKIVQEHSVNKKEGEWVSRDEFARLERQLQEKDALLRQFLKK
jgi:chromosome segregation ATPase